MDMEVLRKKISTFRGDGGRVRITDDGLYMEILTAWEQWKGPMKDFYKTIGVSQTGMASIIGRAKKLRREGHFPVEPFKEIKVEARTKSSGAKGGIQLVSKGGHLIRFSRVDDLLEFLSKAEVPPEPQLVPVVEEAS